MSKAENDRTAEAAPTASEAAAAEARELGDAGSRLSTAPREERDDAEGGAAGAEGSAAAFGIVGWSRWFWRQLTSMRVALILLFLLSLGSIPGSLIPQTSVDELKVRDFQAQHETLAPIYDKLQLFQVYSSVWFSAIYILLFISLIGCIVPRTWQFTGQLRARPPGAPKRLTRLPAYTTWRTTAAPEAALGDALAILKRCRFRAHTVGDAVAAEKGYLRETGNLLFHIALIVLLLAFATGQLFKSEGGKLIVEGGGFSNTLTQYDDFKSGSLFSTDDLAPFSFTLDEFTGTYERSGPQLGTPRTFQAKVRYSTGSDTRERTSVIQVNKPLEIDGAKVYLLSHGYAPVVTVRDGRGKVVLRDAVPLLPIDNNISSSGAIKVMDGYRDKNGKRDQLGFAAFFVPTYGGKGSGQMFSRFPALDFPVLNIGAYHGSLGVDAGLPQNVYQLNTKKMKAFKDAKGAILKKTLLPGDTLTLPNGAGSITFEKDIKEWASFQVSQQPGGPWALAGAVCAIVGLAGSLFIQRRRVWVRAVRGADGVTVVEMAGLGRSESAKLPEELAELAGVLHARAPTAPERAEPADAAEPADPVAAPESPESADPADPAAETLEVEGAEK
ncbi:cytochrome c biogenesis protein ResB [Streptomyces sp. NPDC051569]|uniref:cytochrome c biogenesis protein ResB n=1 Tax=Streptomyces sp. NPDC051569 TaxID=3365661 RepID=UPI00379EB9B9